MEALYKSENIEIAYDPDTRILLCNWRGPQNKQLIADSGGVILQLFKEKQKHGCASVLNDNTLKTGPWHDSIPFAVNEWFPLMTQAGLKHFAWVFSRDFFTELTARQILPQIRTVKVVKPFFSRDEAYSWLLSQP